MSVLGFFGAFFKRNPFWVGGAAGHGPSRMFIFIPSGTAACWPVESVGLPKTQWQLRAREQALGRLGEENLGEAEQTVDPSAEMETGPDIAELAHDIPHHEEQDGGDGGPAMHVNHDSECMVATEPGVQHLDFSQLPVEALLSALNRKPESELREASGCLTALGAKLGTKLVAIRQTSARPGVPKSKIKPEIRTACIQCRRTHFKCDSEKPCGRCMSKGWANDCSFEADEYEVSPTKNSAQRPRKKPPIQKAGFSSSGDKLCEHGMEKRYCMHQSCVAQGSGKAMCKHGKRKRSCVDPDCIRETEDRRRQIIDGRCKHGVQMRCCTQDECRIDFQLAGHQYREKLKDRKRGSPDEAGDGVDKPKTKRGRPPGPRVGGARIAGEGDDMHDGTEGSDKAAAAAVMALALAGQDVQGSSLISISSVSLALGQDLEAEKQGEDFAGKEVPLQAHLSVAAPTSDDVRHSDLAHADPPPEIDKRGFTFPIPINMDQAPPPPPPVAQDGSGDAMGDPEATQKQNREDQGEDTESEKADDDMPMGTALPPEHLEVVDGAHVVPSLDAPSLNGEHVDDIGHPSGDATDGLEPVEQSETPEDAEQMPGEH